ncbi:unnamed protein product [Nezara viridula]|uniref:Uncharacterized protein n=1 Tax=Nezara viridula TaxID=85310 RepID=A0A9P0HE81_NEZVI|nr:unnamed protein product [Nezara viridula]
MVAVSSVAEVQSVTLKIVIKSANYVKEVYLWRTLWRYPARICCGCGGRYRGEIAVQIGLCQDMNTISKNKRGTIS